MFTAQPPEAALPRRRADLHTETINRLDAAVVGERRALVDHGDHLVDEAVETGDHRAACERFGTFLQEAGEFGVVHGWHWIS